MANQSPRDMREYLRNLERLAKNGNRAARMLIEKSPGGSVEGIEQIIEANKKLTPAAPVELVVQTSIYMTPDLRQRGAATLTFAPVTKAVTGQDLLVDKYELWGQNLTANALNDTTAPYPNVTAPGLSFPGQGFHVNPAAEPQWVLLSSGPDPDLIASGLELNSIWMLRVRAIGVFTVAPGLWSEEREVRIVPDDTPPPQPTKPILNVTLGTIGVRWDSMSVSGPMPSDFKTLHVAQGGNPAPETIVAELDRTSNLFVIPDAPYYQPQFFRFRAEDMSGNLSPWSEMDVAVTSPLVDSSEMEEVLRKAREELAAAKEQLEAELGALEGDLAELDGAVTAVEGVVVDLGGAVSAVETKAEDALTAASDANTAAGAAQTAAEDAAADATEALRQAGLAQTSADGKNNVFYDEPLGTAGLVKGDTWFDRPNGLIKVWSGTAWVEPQLGTNALKDLAITNAKIFNLDGVKITAQSIKGISIAAQTITVDKLLVGSTDNFINESDFTNGGASWPLAATRQIVDGQGRNGGPVFRMTGTTEINSAYNKPDARPMTGATVWRFVAWVRSSVYAAGGTYTFFSRVRNAAGVFSYPAISPVTPALTAGVWTKITGIINAPNTSIDYTFALSLQASFPTGEYLDFDSVSATRMGDGSLIVDGAVTANSIAANAITAIKIAANAITAGKIAANAVTANTIAANAIVAGKIAVDAVTTNTIVANAIVAGKIAVDAVTTNTIVANAITTAKIATNAVTANEIAANTITSNEINAGSIRTAILTANSITTDMLQADSITAKHTITGSSIVGATITGSILQTNTTGKRIIITDRTGDGSDVRFYGPTGAEFGQLQYLTVAEQGGGAGADVLRMSGPGQTSAVNAYKGGSIYMTGVSASMSANGGSVITVAAAQAISMFGQTTIMGKPSNQSSLIVNSSTSTGSEIAIQQLGSLTGVLGNVPSTGNHFGLVGVGRGIFLVSTTGGALYAPPAYSLTTTAAANLQVDSAGVFRRSTSALKYKILPEELVADPAWLDVPMKDWYDKTAYESMAKATEALNAAEGPLKEGQSKLELAGMMRSEYDAIDLDRVPGIIAEDVEAAGAKEFVLYGPDGEVEGVMYDRFALVRTQLLNDKLNAALERIEQLEALIK